MPAILVVDDDSVTRVVLRVMLERSGAEVVEADSVDAARSVLADADFDLVICDYAMPDANGLDLLEACPDLEGRFVLLTGTKERDDLGDDRVEKVSAYLTKPVGSEELSELIAAMLGESQSSLS